MASDLRIGILGGAGRMGQMNIRQAVTTSGCLIGGVTARPGSKVVGQDAGVLSGIGMLGVNVSDDLHSMISNVDVVVDFTSPELTVEAAQLSARAGVPLVIGTTGLSTDEETDICAASSHIAVVRAANTSVGVTLLLALAEQAARMLGIEYDIEVLEMHHRNKVDAPSGTALALGEALSRGRDIQLEKAKKTVRNGYTGPRQVGEIGFATLRGGDVAGEHEVIFAAEGERVILGHKASSRQVFAAGAIRAALWIRDKAPGFYTMFDVLGLGNNKKT